MWATTTFKPVGSPTTTASGRRGNKVEPSANASSLQSRTSARAPVKPDSSSTGQDIITVGIPGGRSSASLASATSMAAIEPFVSQEPRP